MATANQHGRVRRVKQPPRFATLRYFSRPAYNCDGQPDDFRKWVIADVEKIQQVFYQLISNAVHNPPGVEICIEAIAEKPTFQFTITDTGTDTGIGMNLPEQKNIFELCLKLPQKRQLARINLGLCLCKQLLMAHGGQIAVYSQVEEGTKIEFTLPTDM